MPKPEARYRPIANNVNVKDHVASVMYIKGPWTALQTEPLALLGLATDALGLARVRDGTPYWPRCQVTIH